MLPDIFDDEKCESMDSAEFDRQWDQTMRTWLPTIDDLQGLGDMDVELLSSMPLPIDRPHDEFILAVKRRNLIGLEMGRRAGWWTSYTAAGPDTPPIRIMARDFPDQTMAHVMAHVGFFPSVSQARKNGWDRPIELGLHRVGKNRLVEIS